MEIDVGVIWMAVVVTIVDNQAEDFTTVLQIIYRNKASINAIK